MVLWYRHTILSHLAGCRRCRGQSGNGECPVFIHAVASRLPPLKLLPHFLHGDKGLYSADEETEKGNILICFLTQPVGGEDT